MQFSILLNTSPHSRIKELIPDNLSDTRRLMPDCFSSSLAETLRQISINLLKSILSSLSISDINSLNLMSCSKTDIKTFIFIKENCWFSKCWTGYKTSLATEISMLSEESDLGKICLLYKRGVIGDFCCDLINGFGMLISVVRFPPVILLICALLFWNQI
eukprot:NODE_472_length_8038_cov_0.413150.p7 type:complete len:160 gc:universal NODE_472_length_8038_cov_0.413150:883-404(-)